ncbi:pyruvate kinase [Sulfurisphaera tokodaii]|uniref:Pyruvate kinase n=2 Tax=Sulfurisphaera tokodaii TaxID=111955 RepID=Q970H8_SULTO|nr:pyruvate kinase [Sulfurisphaera tokodaii]BAB66695.1 pyruvate kinase [Sulfurisphaera tokodaii str. 7]HII73483.1 pyruvate kinase [Sulfurisphaera tokodaii]
MFRKTKIIATLGPSSENHIDELVKYVDVIRLNFAHGDKEQHEKYFNLVKNRVPILVDLPGPKLRIGDLGKNMILLKPGDTIEFGTQIPVDDILFFKLIRKGSEVLISDGRIRVKIIEAGNNYAKGLVEEGGILTSRKGINIPDSEIPVGLTDRDLELLKYALEMGATFIGLSFVTSPEEIRKAKEIVKDQAWIIAKIEKKSALKKLKEIIREADGVMVARGDLGVEVGLANLPQTQRRIVRLTRLYGKPVILATQVLESMVTSPIPTRAEVIDVANSIIQGVDAIMLSDETAMGQYPIDAVRTLHELILSVERSFKPRPPPPLKNIDDAIAYSAVSASNLASSSGIVVYTRTGASALRISRLRPVVPIIVLTQNQRVYERLKLCYGIYSFISEELNSLDNIVEKSKNIARQVGLKNTIIIIAGGIEEGSTRFLKVEEI